MRKSRVLLAAAGLFFMLLCVWVRVAWLQVALHDHFVARAAENQLARHKLIPRRGELLDCNGRVLAHDLPVSRISLIHAQLKDPAGVARALAPLMGLEPRALRRRIESTPGFLLLASDAAPELGDRVRALRLPGVIVDDDTRRDYPLANAAFREEPQLGM
jgi:cell division protein FtsI/penicillin-binding protein 2